MRRVECLLTVLLAIGGLFGLAAGAEEEAPSGANALKAAGVELDAKKHEVRVAGTVCLDRGILEYLICLPNTFEHEAIFSVTCKPSVLHLSLLAVGFEPYAFTGDFDWWETAREHQPSRVRIEVEYEQDGKKVRRRISEFLVNREGKDAAVSDAWIFTGSFFFEREGKSRYAADTTGAVIGLCREGASVLQYGERAGIPYQGEDQGLEINTDTVPAKGTKVTLIFARQEEKAKGKEKDGPGAPPAKENPPPAETKP